MIGLLRAAGTSMKRVVNVQVAIPTEIVIALAASAINELITLVLGAGPALTYSGRLG